MLDFLATKCFERILLIQVLTKLYSHFHINYCRKSKKKLKKKINCLALSIFAREMFENLNRVIIKPKSFFALFQPCTAFHIKTNNSICSANQIRPWHDVQAIAHTCAVTCARLGQAMKSLH